MVAVDEEGLNELLPMLLQGTQGRDMEARHAYATLLSYFCSGTEEDYEDYRTLYRPVYGA